MIVFHKKKQLSSNTKMANVVLGFAFVIMMILSVRAGVLSLSTEVDGKNLKDFVNIIYPMSGLFGVIIIVSIFIRNIINSVQGVIKVFYASR